MRLTSDNPHFIVINGLLISSDGTLTSCLSKDTHINKPNSANSLALLSYMLCRSLQDIHIPNSVTHIGDCAFGGCEDIGNINIPNSVNHIGDSAFWGCKALQSIHIPKGSMAKFMQLLPEGLHNKLVEIDRVSSSMFPF